MLELTEDRWIPYHREALSRLCSVAQSLDGVHTHSAGPEYTSLMSCFLMHNVAGGRALLSLLDGFGPEWFPSTHGYAIARTMFETDVAAHYISEMPKERAHQYILFEHVLNKRAMEACRKHRASKDPGWRETMDREWQTRWAERETDIDAKFEEVKPLFTRAKGRMFNTWSGLSLRKLAVKVDHEEAYDTFYSHLSSFVHGDVHSANHFLRLQSDGVSWSQRANWYDVGEVLHDGASFLTCLMTQFGKQFQTWEVEGVRGCWDDEERSNRRVQSDGVAAPDAQRRWADSMEEDQSGDS